MYGLVEMAHLSKVVKLYYKAELTCSAGKSCPLYEKFSRSTARVQGTDIFLQCSYHIYTFMTYLSVALTVAQHFSQVCTNICQFHVKCTGSVTPGVPSETVNIYCCIPAGGETLT